VRYHVHANLNALPKLYRQITLTLEAADDADAQELFFALFAAWQPDVTEIEEAD